MSEMKNFDESLIRAKAFELWLDRGAPIGSPESDWYSAKLLLESPPPPRVEEVVEVALEPAPLESVRSEQAPLTTGSVLSRAQRRAKPKQEKAPKARPAARR